MNFGPLRVFNDDTVAPAQSFPQHGHREMEIITYVIEGALEHKDNLGNSGIIRPGAIQRMTAGTGVRHSEFNPSERQPVRLLQLWIMPSTQRLRPSWEQKSFSLAGKKGRLLPIAVPADRNGKNTVQIHQDATIYASLLAPDQSVTHTLADGRRAYIFVKRELQLSTTQGSGWVPRGFSCPRSSVTPISCPGRIRIGWELMGY